MALVLNSSPHIERGAHVTMLQYLEEGLREAGVHLVEEGSIPNEVLDEISRDLVGRKVVVRYINSYYDQFE